MPAPLTPVKQHFISDFGNLYASYGWKRLNGLIIGLLLAEDEPVSLDDISIMLKRSKGPISESVRQLAANGLIHKRTGPKNRRDYYTVDPDIFYNNYRFNMRIVKKNRILAEQYLAEIRNDRGRSDRKMEANLRHMLSFYTLMESFYNNFSVEWEKFRNGK